MKAATCESERSYLKPTLIGGKQSRSSVSGRHCQIYIKIIKSIKLKNKKQSSMYKNYEKMILQKLN